MSIDRIGEVDRLINMDRGRDKNKYKYKRTKFLPKNIQESLRSAQLIEGDFDEFILDNMHTINIEDRERVLEADEDIKLLLGVSLSKENINKAGKASFREDVEGFDFRQNKNGEKRKVNTKITIQDCIALNYHDPRNEYDSWIYNKMPKYLDFDKINWIKSSDDNITRQIKKILITKATLEQYKKAWVKVYDQPAIFISSEEEFNETLENLQGFIKYLNNKLGKKKRGRVKILYSMQEYATEYLDYRIMNNYSEQLMDSIYREYEALCKMFNLPDQIKNPKTYIVKNEKDYLGIISLAFGLNGSHLSNFNTDNLKNLNNHKDVVYYNLKIKEKNYIRPINPQMQNAFNQLMIDFVVRDGKYGNKIMFKQTKPYENTKFFNKLYKIDINRIIESKYYDDVEDMNIDQIEYAKLKDFCKYHNIKKI